MENYDWLRPVIGAGIGYITNLIAVKMMFRPVKEYKIGKLRIPFTPGIIPRNKARIAEAIGQVISENLLDEVTLKNKLLSDDVKFRIRESIVGSLNNMTGSTDIIEESVIKYVEKEKYDTTMGRFVDKVSESIHETVKEADIGNIIQEKINEETNDKFKGSIVGFLGGKAISDTISREVRDKVNIYIEENGKEIIRGMVQKEVEKYTKSSIGEVTTNIGVSDFDLVSFLMKIYENIVIEKIHSMLVTIDISTMVKDRIDEMDIVELEDLLLKIMKKELNALVDLGAIIGFILGLVNLLF